MLMAEEARSGGLRPGSEGVEAHERQRCGDIRGPHRQPNRRAIGQRSHPSPGGSAQSTRVPQSSHAPPGTLVELSR